MVIHFVGIKVPYRLIDLLNRQDRQERKDIAKDHLHIADKRFLRCALSVLRGSNWVGGG